MLRRTKADGTVVPIMPVVLPRDGPGELVALRRDTSVHSLRSSGSDRSVRDSTLALRRDDSFERGLSGLGTAVLLEAGGSGNMSRRDVDMMMQPTSGGRNLSRTESIDRLFTECQFPTSQSEILGREAPRLDRHPSHGDPTALRLDSSTLSLTGTRRALKVTRSASNVSLGSQSLSNFFDDVGTGNA